MKTDLTQRADLIAAAHGRHVARIAGVRAQIDAEAKTLAARQLDDLCICEHARKWHGGDHQLGACHNGIRACARRCSSYIKAPSYMQPGYMAPSERKHTDDADPLAPVPLIRETPIDVAAFDAERWALTQVIVAELRQALDVRRHDVLSGDIPFRDWAHERANNIAAGLLGNYRIERLP